MATREFNPFEELDSKSILETLNLLPRTLGFVFRSSPFYFLVSNTFGLIQAGLSVVLLWLEKIVIDRVIESIGSEFSWLYVLLPMTLIVVVRIFSSGTTTCSQFVDFMVSEKVNTRANTLVLNKAAKLDLVFYESPQFYDLLYQAKENIGRMHGVMYGLLGLISQFFTLIAMFGLLSILHPLAFIVLVATISPRVFVEGYTARRQFDLDVELMRNYRLTWYF